MPPFTSIVISVLTVQKWFRCIRRVYFADGKHCLLCMPPSACISDVLLALERKTGVSSHLVWLFPSHGKTPMYNWETLKQNVEFIAIVRASKCAFFDMGASPQNTVDRINNRLARNHNQHGEEENHCTYQSFEPIVTCQPVLSGVHTWKVKMTGTTDLQHILQVGIVADNFRNMNTANTVYQKGVWFINIRQPFHLEYAYTYDVSSRCMLLDGKVCQRNEGPSDFYLPCVAMVELDCNQGRLSVGIEHCMDPITVSDTLPSDTPYRFGCTIPKHCEMEIVSYKTY